MEIKTIKNTNVFKKEKQYLGDKIIDGIADEFEDRKHFGKKPGRIFD